jgi:anti-sigma regulatory factor (Ser/Thr protein kinase)
LGHGQAALVVHTRTTLPSHVDSPAAARAFARAAVAGERPLVPLDDVTLVVSELVTNAVLHGTGDVTIRVDVAAAGITVEVADDEPDLVDAPPAAKDAPAGRGLLLVSRVARRWGVRPEGAGKVVWAELAG